MTDSDFLSGAELPAGRRIVFLDVDGTLIDSFPGIRAGFLHALDVVGRPHPSEEVISQIAGPPMEQTFASLGLSDADVEQAFDAYMEFTRREGLDQSVAYPQMGELLARLKEQGFYLSTATSKGEEFARIILGKLGLLEHLDFLGAAQERGARRGKAAVIRYVLDSLELHERTADILMVGDRTHDIEGARTFGIETVAVTWGYGRAEEWAEAAHTVTNTVELENVIHDWAS